MAVFSIEGNRNVIPRWRAYEATRRIGELGSVAPPRAHRLVIADFLESKVADWQRYGTVGHASDLVGAGVTLGREEEVTEAARFLLREDLSVTSWARELAKRALSTPENAQTVPRPEEVDESILRERIRTLRNLLRAEPNDPVTWVDLSRCYACIGLREQATRNMTVALQLARDNRFVLRSASRLWVNLDEPERAHETIVRTDRTRHDPWLLAAEVAIGSIAKKSPKLVKVAQQMLLRRQYPPSHISELASAVATLELGSGSVKKSKKWFGQSLEDPTENSIAQASWASRHHSSIGFDDRYLELPNTFEAESWSYYHNGEWKHAVEKCKLWLFDQPFSSRPCILGSSLAATVFEDYSTSKWFANLGLIPNPSNSMLLNNLAFALIGLGDIEEAKRTLSRASRLQLSYRDQAILQATKGLFEFRTGNLERGRELYSDARSMAKKIQGRDGSKVFALASAFYAIEEASQEVSDIPSLLSEALQIISTHPDPIFRVLEHRLAEMTITKRGPRESKTTILEKPRTLEQLR